MKISLVQQMENTCDMARLYSLLDRDPRSFAVVLSGPPGVGKTSIGQGLMGTDMGLRRCVTTTTRNRRPEEVEGVDYHFVSDAVFRSKLEEGAFVEWAEVYGHLYGATIEAVAEALSEGRAMLLVVDVQGSVRWTRVLQGWCMSIFVMPPSLEELERRLVGRKTEETSALKRRMQNVQEEIEQATSFDYLVVNQELQQAIEDICTLIEAERHRPQRMPELLAEFGVST